MAKLFTEVTIAGSYKNLSKSTRGATSELNNFSKKAKKISLAVSAAFAGIAIVGLRALTEGIKEATKAYQEDEQSQRTLAAVINNSIKGQKAQKKSVEQSISGWQTLSNVQDDKIRPAYGYLILATKSITKSNRLMNISLDLAAGRNIDLKTAASAVGRAYAGNLLAINKLLPGVKNLKDPLAEVERRFKGLAKLSATNDPFTAFNIVMDEFKEKLGKSFLPIMKQFVAYLQTPEFQTALDDIAYKVQEFGAWFMSSEGQNTFKTWMSDLKDLITLGGEFLGLVIAIKKLFTPDTPKKRVGLITDYIPGQKFAPGTGAELANRLSGDKIPQDKVNWAPIQPLQPINIVINGASLSSEQIIKTLQANARSKGVSLASLLR